MIQIFFYQYRLLGNKVDFGGGGGGGGEGALYEKQKFTQSTLVATKV